MLMLVEGTLITRGDNVRENQYLEDTKLIERFTQNMD